MPNKIVEGSLLSDEVIHEIVAYGTKALIVSGKSMVKMGYVQALMAKLKDNGLDSVVFSEVMGEPTDIICSQGVNVYKNEQCDMIIGFGGGSVIDTMKAIAVISASNQSISDFKNQDITCETCPMVAIPTTAGTGSEATKFTIITDTKENVKMLLKGESLMPDFAIIDPFYTLSTSKKVTAYTGLDALCHAIEAFTSKKAQELSSTYAKSAIKRIFNYLPTVYKDGKNLEARRQMQIAALEAGIAFNNSSVTIIHGMSRPIGALFHISHGLSNAILMKDCIEFAISGDYERFAAVSQLVCSVDNSYSDKEASEMLVKRIQDLLIELEIPTLNQLGVDENEFIKYIPKMTKDALDSSSPSNTIRQVTPQDIESIYRKII